MERRWGGELRMQGRTLTGAAMVYGDLSPDYNERFLPGAFGPVKRTDLNLQHDRSVVLVRGAALTDTPEALLVRAELPETAAALSLVKRGALNGFSVEFHPRAEHLEDGIRVVERADLTGLALVDRGAYPAAKAEVRAKSGRTLRATIPIDHDLVCECIAQGQASAANCVNIVKFSRYAADLMVETIAKAEREVLAVFKDYSRPLGSARRGTLRAAPGDGGVRIEIDLPTGEAGDLAVSASEAAGVIARPLLDYDRSEFTDTETVRHVERPHLRAILVGSTDARGGWPDARIDYEGERARQRRRRLWL